MVEAEWFLSLASRNGRSSKRKEKPRSTQRKSVARQLLCSHRVNLSKIDSVWKTRQKNPNYQTANHDQSSRLELSQRMEVKQKEKCFVHLCGYMHRYTPGQDLSVHLDNSPCKQDKIQVFSLLRSCPKCSRCRIGGAGLV